MTHQIVMTPVGWTFMIIAWTVIGSLTLWCFYKLLTTQSGGGDDADEGAGASEPGPDK